MLRRLFPEANELDLLAIETVGWIFAALLFAGLIKWLS